MGQLLQEISAGGFLFAILFTNAIIQPRVKKPPAGIMKKSIGFELITGSLIPIQLPEPNISLIEPIMKSARVKPSPIPNPSRIDGTSLFFEAKASALPNIIQFTVIRDRKIPSDE